MDTVIEQRLERIRDRDLPISDFRDQIRAISFEMSHAVAKTQFRGANVVLVPILRAGIGMLDGALTGLPDAKVGFISISRKEDGPLEHHVHYESLPDLADKLVVVLDPMLATGGSALLACRRLKNAGAESIAMINILAAPEGVQAVRDSGLDIQMVVGKVDEGLDSDYYIVPGLGDAGDRLYGDKS